MPTLKQTADSAIDPWALQERISTSDARYALATTLMPLNDLSYIDYRSGVMASGDGGRDHMACKVQAATGMNITVESGNVVVNTNQSGPYMGAIDSQKTLTVEAASTTANRIDVVMVRIYDDLNPQLGGVSGVRKLAVELWTGDEVTGEPSVPTIPLAAGWHPLAHIRVMANTSSVTPEMIEDMRGPGLVTRGGIRPFYGADAAHDGDYFDQAGAYPGEQRWMHTNGFQHQIFYGENTDPRRSGWRGVHNELIYNANSTLGTQWNMASKITRELCTITIPDPGTPYMIKPTARVSVRMSRGVSLDMAIRFRNGPAINYASYQTPLALSGNTDRTGDYRHIFNIAPMAWGPLTGETTIALEAHTYDNWGPSDDPELWKYKGWRHWDSDMRQNLLQVSVFPSTVQPPNDHPNDGSGDDIADKNSR